MTTLEPKNNDDDELAVPVDLPEQRPVIDAEVLASRVNNKRPALPVWMRSKADFREFLRWEAQFLGHQTWFHSAHSPLYFARLCRWTPRGLWVVTRGVFGWVFDMEASPARHDAVRRNAVNEYMALSAQRNRRVRQRGIPALVALVAVVVGVWVLVAVGAPEWQAIALLSVIGLLGKIGTPRDRRVTDPSTVTSFKSEPLRADQLTLALQSLGIAAMTAKAGQISYPAPIRDIGTGWLASVDLPIGVTTEMVADKRPQLASGLRRPIGCIWPDQDVEAHAGRLELTVLKVPMSKARPAKYPLRDAGVTDIFTAVPFGTDQRGRKVEMPLIESNLLIGSLPGAGKTASLRCVLAGCALDPTVQLSIFELKGSGDLEAFERISHEYASGVDDASIEASLNGLRGLFADLEQRAAKLKQLRTEARDLVPDSKVTRDLADRRKLGLFVRVFVVDEAQELFAHPEYGKEAGTLATAIIKRGRALGVILILATQKPDKDSLPTGVSSNVGTRFCLRVMDQTSNDMVLGTSAYKNGIRATHFTRSDRGIGYLVGALDTPTVTKSYYLDAEAADAIAARAYIAREKAGLLSGHAIGERAAEAPKLDLLADVHVVFGTVGGERLWHETLLEHLQELRPAAYVDWDVRQLGAELRDRGVETIQIAEDVDGERVNRRGVRLADLDKVLAGGPEHAEIEQ